jgi:hypothetical protein
MFIIEYDVPLKGANVMWVMILAMIGVTILAMIGFVIFVMVVLHRKPRGASAHHARGRHEHKGLL